MVHDLNFNSHPNKSLEDHIGGVLKGTLPNCSTSVARYAAIFHDLGKMNPNFQRKLYGKDDGYSKHSSLSVIAFVKYAMANSATLITESGVKSNEEFYLFVFKVIIVIAKHHGNLPDLEKGIDIDECSDFGQALSFIQENSNALPFVEFIKKHFIQECKTFDSAWGKQENGFLRFNSKLQRKAWQVNSLQNFMSMQNAFSSLVLADKRDAGQMSNFFFKQAVEKNSQELSSGLNFTFDKFNSSNMISTLNSQRTLIRLEAVDGIKRELQTNKRVFTLTAPTGAGKTYTLLSVADEIRKEKGELGIVYALPFLSITEQVDSIASDLVSDVISINSKTENKRIASVQERLEQSQSTDDFKELICEDFIEQIFDHPFIITTFVQFFESLLSNKNATLLKMPNFKNRIFLIDEIQALPPRLYIFFSAWLTKFCELNNSYAILSTATMPNFAVPVKDHVDIYKRADLLFKDYETPKELIEPYQYFSSNVFNRYEIRVVKDSLQAEELRDHILKQDSSCLIILNTIADTKELYNLMDDLDNVLLLNTHFIPNDRSNIIQKAKDYLEKKEKVILISTQLIEAGVDIDFPIVYRDLAPLPSLIQSAGRCNRNKNIDLGQVYFFELISDKGQGRAKLIYRNEGRDFLKFAREHIVGSVLEKDLFQIQSDFFKSIQQNLTIGEFADGKNTENMIECVNNGDFEKLGKFRLINSDVGDQQQYYILENEDDCVYEELIDILNSLRLANGFEQTKKIKIDLKSFMKRISGRLLSIRVNKYNKDKMPTQCCEELLDIRFISSDNYSSVSGLVLNNSEDSFL